MGRPVCKRSKRQGDFPRMGASARPSSRARFVIMYPANLCRSMIGAEKSFSVTGGSPPGRCREGFFPAGVQEPGPTASRHHARRLPSLAPRGPGVPRRTSGRSTDGTDAVRRRPPSSNHRRQCVRFHQTALGDEVQDERENLLMHFTRKVAACLRQAGMIGNVVTFPESQEISQRP